VGRRELAVRRPPCRRTGCGHVPDGHPPFVPGGDEPGWCGTCGCWQYIPQRPWTRLLAWLRERPPPVPVDVLRQHPVPFPLREQAVDDHRTRLDIPRARPYAGDLDEARLRVPRPGGGPPW
jgi:hypothetical protein